MLFYVTSDMKIMSVAIAAIRNSLTAALPRELFAVPQMGMVGGIRNTYVADHSGQRFLVSAATGDQVAVPIIVVQNWTATLAK